MRHPAACRHGHDPSRCGSCWLEFMVNHDWQPQRPVHRLAEWWVTLAIRVAGPRPLLVVLARWAAPVRSGA